MRNRIHSGSNRLQQAFGRWWRKYIVDECPEARAERIRQERMEDLKVYTALREAMRLWEIESRKSQVKEAEHATVH
jgi:hypothetical protein